MNWVTSEIYDSTLDHIANGKAVVVNKGGTRSGKTWSLLQCLVFIALHQRNKLISVVGESIPFLKRGAMRDFKQLLGDMWDVDKWNATDKVYTFPTTGSSIEFFSADNEGKVHGSARDYLFINECYFIPYDIYRQLAVRTRKAIMLDYNPRSRFWVDEQIIGKEGSALIHSTYKDNPFLTSRQVAEIESYQGDTNWWRVYGLGETGSVEGLVYTNWQIVHEMPEQAKARFYCIDFGFTNDPTAILRVSLSGGELWVEEIAYRTGMLNRDIADALLNAGAGRFDNIVADSAEPKSIAEINNITGLNIKPTSKGQGSVTAGITAVQGYKLNVMADALGTIDELRNYSWKRDTNGGYVNVPVDRYNHALDALRYGVTTFLSTRKSINLPRVHMGHIC